MNTLPERDRPRRLVKDVAPQEVRDVPSRVVRGRNPEPCDASEGSLRRALSVCRSENCLGVFATHPLRLQLLGVTGLCLRRALSEVLACGNLKRAADSQKNKGSLAHSRTEHGHRGRCALSDRTFAEHLAQSAPPFPTHTTHPRTERASERASDRPSERPNEGASDWATTKIFKRQPKKSNNTKKESTTPKRSRTRK